MLSGRKKKLLPIHNVIDVAEDKQLNEARKAGVP
jgi:hypothetical protein